MLFHKKYFFVFIFLLTVFSGFAQDSKFPTTELKKLDRRKIDSKEILNKEGYTVISFWATWCKPCILELNAISDMYEDWTDEMNVQVVAVSIDDARSSSKVSVFVSSKDWPFEVYLDENSDLKRALNINNIPHSVVVDKDGNVIWQHAGYLPGDEEILFEKLQTLSK
ncbi:MAG: TlpA disulfide reductase family protein [Bacteroidota bacterium]